MQPIWSTPPGDGLHPSSAIAARHANKKPRRTMWSGETTFEIATVGTLGVEMGTALLAKLWAQVFLVVASTSV